MIWFAGLRGAIAYALAKRWGGPEATLAVEGTTMMLVLLTTFGLGGTVGSVIKALDLEMDGDGELDSIENIHKYWDSGGSTTEGNNSSDGSGGDSITSFRASASEHMRMSMNQKTGDSPTNADESVVNNSRKKRLVRFVSKVDNRVKAKCGGNILTDVQLADELSGPGTPKELRLRGSIIRASTALVEDIHNGVLDSPALSGVDMSNPLHMNTHEAFGTPISVGNFETPMSARSGRSLAATVAWTPGSVRKQGDLNASLASSTSFVDGEL
eukprot:SAG31_NODE_4228_length_3442_cov_2.372719_2_plen_270_part_00